VGRCFFRDGESYGQPLRVGALAAGPALPEQWGLPKRSVDFYDVKGDLEALAAPLTVTTEAAAHPGLHPGRSAQVRIAGELAGWVGELHPRLVRHFELPGAPIVFEVDVHPLVQQPTPAARPVSKLPVVRRDLAVVVDEAIPAQEIVDALVAIKPPFVDRLALFDVYRGPGIDPGKKSLAILVLIQDTARTLTDAEIDATVATLLRELQKRFGGTLRR
jgi:phenylalanyl-tRNA synthetase beta chain